MATTPKYKVFNSRNYKRLQANYLLKYNVLETGEGPFISNIKDLSVSGVRFWTNQALTEGSILKISMLVPPLGRALETLAQVRRVRYSVTKGIYYIGLAFFELREEDRNALNAFIEDLTGMESEESLDPVVTRFSPFQPISQ